MKKLMLRKIVLEDFINVLIDIYEKGADYIDLVAMPDDVEDTLIIQVMQDYLREEEEQHDITKDDIEDLING